MNKSALFILVMVAIVIVLSITQIAVSNSLSTKGVVLGKLEDQVATYQRENSILREKLLFASSLTHIASSAATLGFVNTKKILYLDTSGSVAIKP